MRKRTRQPFSRHSAMAKALNRRRLKATLNLGRGVLCRFLEENTRASGEWGCQVTRWSRVAARRLATRRRAKRVGPRLFATRPALLGQSVQRARAKRSTLDTSCLLRREPIPHTAACSCPLNASLCKLCFIKLFFEAENTRTNLSGVPQFQHTRPAIGLHQ